MDWNNYLAMISWVGKGSAIDALDYAEPAFALLLWSSAQLGFGVYGSNLVGTLIFCSGLFRYAKTTPQPWVALTVAMPMLVTVVAMSGNRQAAAIGILLWVVARWDKSEIVERITTVLLAALFHASALVFLVFVMADLKVRPVLRYFLTGLFLASAILILQWSGRAEYYDNLYGSGQTDLTRSPGALLHVLFNAGPAFLALAFSKRTQSFLLPNQLYRHMALLCISLLPLSLVVSTASSRISLYLFPVSMYVFSSIPVIMSSPQQRLFLRYLIAAAMVGLLYVWLGFANNSHAHIPYGNLLSTPSALWQLCC
jgi:hypothetical protein